jgi:transposase
LSRKSHIDPTQKLKCVESYLSGKQSQSQLLFEFNIKKNTLKEWMRKYNLQGASGLLTPTTNKFYPEALKRQAAVDYLSGKFTCSQICDKYGILAYSILQRWIRQYNGHEFSKSSNSGRITNMANNRKTTQEERLTIVEFCIANAFDYQATCEQFNVSYHQVYSWVRKCKKDGPSALIDSRGKPKRESQLSDVEKLQAKIDQIEAKNRLLQMENDYLKKLEEIERGLGKPKSGK